MMQTMGERYPSKSSESLLLLLLLLPSAEQLSLQPPPQPLQQLPLQPSPRPPPSHHHHPPLALRVLLRFFSHPPSAPWPLELKLHPYWLLQLGLHPRLPSAGPVSSFSLLQAYSSLALAWPSSSSSF